MSDVLTNDSFIKEHKKGIHSRAVASRSWREVEFREIRGFRGRFENLAEYLNCRLGFSKEGLGNSFQGRSGIWWRQDYQSSCLLISRMQPPVFIPVLDEVVSKQHAMMPSESPVVNCLLHCICLHFPCSILCLLDAEQLILILLDRNHSKTIYFLEFSIKVLQQFPIKVYLSKGTIMCKKCEKWEWPGRGQGGAVVLQISKPS